MKTTINKTGYLFSLIMIMSLIVSPLMAQENDDTRGQRGHDVRYERLKSMKVAYITQELNLTPAEAEKFWPVYNEKYKKVLPIKTVARYYESEKRFRSHLLHQIRDGKFKEGKEEYRRTRDN